jgi:uncharacterized YigZ family protein
MLISYKTLKSSAETLIKEKGSKFLGYAIPVANEMDIKAELQKLKILHPQATHFCYAYKTGVNDVKFRANDDGEPSNSAGTPILGQINSFELSNVLVAVVRYYGGTKLGVGGLVQAYKQAAKEAIEQAEIIVETLKSQFEIRFDYEDLPKTMSLLKHSKVKIVSQNLAESCQINFEIENEKIELIKNQLADLKTLKFTQETINL